MRKLIVLPICLAAYLAWPCVTLYRLNTALQHRDLAALAAGVDWDSVREGLKEDIADGIMGDDAGAMQQATDALPPFGAGFVRGMAGNAVDRMVTPERLVAGVHQSGQMAGVWSMRGWFDSPTRFEVSMPPPGSGADAGAMRLQMDLVRNGWGFAWQVTGAYVPPAMFTRLQGGDTAASGQKVFAGP